MAVGGYNSIIGEFAIVFISTLIYDNYFCPKYHTSSYFNHEKILKKYYLFKPKINISNDAVLTIDSNIISSKIRKIYLKNYMDILIKNEISIPKEIKYYLIMRLLTVFNIEKMEETDYFYSIFLIHYFYNKIKDDGFTPFLNILDEMEELK